jgi:2-polyprenyl-6-hydroxyphenyl methylase/3-demethylubiquinone-9 3-methyltransferase
MEIDNTIYETLGHLWWSEDAGFELTSLRYCVNPVRYAYFRKILRERAVLSGAVLDIGCGGGYLSEEFARDGFHVSGVDPAENSINAARKHADQNNLHIDYRVAYGESLPFADASFDIVACCDVLEHVRDLGQVVREVSRILKPGGIFMFDTVNRTLKNKIALIKVWQDWNIGGFGIPNTHVWDKFVKPEELAELLLANGIKIEGTKGIGPRRNPIFLLFGLLRIRAGGLRGVKVTEVFEMRETDDLSLSYMGWALKRNEGT